jgi:adenylyltransferase/sulfurtransferase
MNDDELLRYSRQIMLPAFDYSGQEKLLNAKVLIVGLGGLGCPVALYLAAAGVGELRLNDFDEVDWSNLQRQIAHAESAVGDKKVDSAAASITRINSTICIVPISEKLTDSALNEHIQQVDVVIDGSDNFTTRRLLNRLCFQQKTALVSGAAIRFEGQVSTFDFREDGPCYECLYPAQNDTDLTCSENGILSPVVGVIGAMQALEAIKVLSDCGTSLAGRLLIFDAMTSQWREMGLSKDPDCTCCGNH